MLSAISADWARGCLCVKHARKQRMYAEAAQAGTARAQQKAVFTDDLSAGKRL